MTQPVPSLHDLVWTLIRSGHAQCTSRHKIITPGHQFLSFFFFTMALSTFAFTKKMYVLDCHPFPQAVSKTKGGRCISYLNRVFVLTTR